MQMRPRFRRPFRRGHSESALARAISGRALRDLRRPHYPNEDVALEKRVADFCRKPIAPLVTVSLSSASFLQHPPDP